MEIRLCSLFLYFLSVIGFITILKKLISFISFIQRNFFPFKNDLVEKYGNDWVIVTGGSEGIGYAWGEEFLKKGFKVCLISRTEEKLKKACEELKKKYKNSEIKYKVFDFNLNYNEKELNDLRNLVKEFDGKVSVLINNVGSLEKGLASSLSDESITKMVNINIKTLVFLTKTIIPMMLKRSKKSLIISSGSMMEDGRLPGRSLYSGSKTFLHAYMDCVSKENKEKIDVTTFVIGSVPTTLNTVAYPLSTSPEEFASSAINQVGIKSEAVGHYKHEILRFLFLNQFTSKIIYWYLMKIIKKDKENKAKKSN